MSNFDGSWMYRFAGIFFIALLVVAAAASWSSAREYELVSPVYKGGYGVFITDAVAPDGDSVAYVSQGVFAGLLTNRGFGNVYVAQRGANGWESVPQMPPATIAPAGFTVDFSESFDLTLFQGFPGPSEGTATRLEKEDVFLSHRTGIANRESPWEISGLALRSKSETLNVAYAGASGDLCHILIARPGGEPLEGVTGIVPPGATQQIYELVRGCKGEAAVLRFVALNNAGGLIAPYCESLVGTEEIQSSGGGRANTFNAIPADGKEVFFTSNVNATTIGSQCENDPSNPLQLFVRLDGSKTLEVSAPEADLGSCAEVPCPGAEARAPSFFEGANEAGTVVYFTTTERLTSSDTDGKRDLYMARIGCVGGGDSCDVVDRRVTSLVQISSGSEAAEVEHVVRLAPDGSRVYFVAHGVLGDEASNGVGVQAAPVRGADNLYVYDVSSGKTAFVADLCSGDEVSGLTGDPRCPDKEGIPGDRSDDELWSNVSAEAQSTRDGGVLVFSSYGRLTGDDMDNAKDVYRYDAASGRLQRVSVGEGGHDANGNARDSASKPVGADATIEALKFGGAARVVEQHEMNTRALDETGERIAFEASEPLSAASVNGLDNVYEWHGGDVSLVSSGSSPTSDCCAVMGTSGRDVFFTTSQGLFPADTDGANDIYDARVGGGFTQEAAEREPCSGDACQGPLTNPAPLLIPGSVSQQEGENYPPPKNARSSPKKRSKQGKKTKKSVPKRKRHGARGARHGGQRKTGTNRGGRA